MKTLLMMVPTLLAAGMMQTPTAPPMKLGLWETTVVTTMKMPGTNAPGMGAPRSTKVHSCMTATGWMKNFGPTSGGNDCVKSNEVWSATGYSVDLTCKMANGTGHVAMIFDGMEAGHGTVHMDLNPNGHALTTDSLVTTHRIGDDCGAVQAGKPVVVQ